VHPILGGFRSLHDVSASTPLVGPCRRILFWLVFLGLIALERSAEAAVCHVSERPSLGISLPGTRQDLSTESPGLTGNPRPAQLDQSPCPGEDFEFKSRSSVPGSTLATEKTFETPAESEDFSLDPPNLRTPLSILNPLERPPR
jgi:hypothetical protein